MLKSVFLCVLLLVGAQCGEEHAVSTLVPESVDATTMSPMSNSSERAAAASGKENSPASILNDNPANFAQYNGKLVANHSGSEPRIVSAEHKSSSGSASVPLILGIVFAVVVTLVGVIVGALFVMRRRFSSWRLERGSGADMKSSLNGAATNEAQSSEENSSTEEKPDTVCRIVDETEKKEDEKAVPMPAVSVNVDGAEIAALPEKKEDEEEPAKQQASPSSSSPLIDDESSKLILPAETPAPEPATDSAPVAQLPEQVSASSLIVNVLNDLSESVAQRLAAKSPAKQSLHNE